MQDGRDVYKLDGVDGLAGPSSLQHVPVGTILAQSVACCRVMVAYSKILTKKIKEEACAFHDVPATHV